MLYVSPPGGCDPPTRAYVQRSSLDSDQVMRIRLTQHCTALRILTPCSQFSWYSYFPGHNKTIHDNSQNNLPIFFTSTTLPSTSSLSVKSSKEHLTSYLSLETPSPHETLSSTQSKLLLKHYQLGHLNMNKLQQLARDGFFGSSGKSLANCEPPLCKACIHGKQHTRPIHQASLQPLDSFHLTPGDCVSADQIESTQPGIILIFKGSPSTSFYHAGTLFVDHASRFLFFTPPYIYRRS